MSSHKKTEKYIWVPRIFALCVILYYGLFALDVWARDASVNERLLAFFVHLLPSIGLGGCLFIAWRKEVLGAILYCLAGVVSMFMFRSYESMEAFIILSFPVFVISILFLISDNLDTRNQYYK